MGVSGEENRADDDEDDENMDWDQAQVRDWIYSPLGMIHSLTRIVAGRRRANGWHEHATIGFSGRRRGAPQFTGYSCTLVS